MASNPAEAVTLVQDSWAMMATGQSDMVWGHASVRDPDDRGVWMKSAGWDSRRWMPRGTERFLTASRSRAGLGDGEPGRATDRPSRRRATLAQLERPQAHSLAATDGTVSYAGAATMGHLGKPHYRSSARNRLGSGGMMRPPAGCPAVARAGEMMAACRRRTTSR
jgi:hypothetical protein